ncbi:MAG: viologen exporter family transport system permease protein [Actinomycetota bacterium]
MGELRGWARRLRRQLGIAARMDLLVVLRSRSQAAVWIVTDFIAYTTGVGAVLLVAERFNGIAGWTKPQLVFLTGFAATASALRGALFGYNISAISRRIGRGQLDHTLTQPQPLLLSLLTEGFTPLTSVGALVPGLVLLVTGALTIDIAVTPWFVARLVVCLVSSMLLVLAASFAIGSAAFWAPRGAEEISTRAGNLLELTEFPLDPLPSALRTALVTALPAGFVSWFPVSALLDRRSEHDWLYAPLVAALAIAGAALLFKKGLHRYAHTGSSRYSDFGHRR